MTRVASAAVLALSLAAANHASAQAEADFALIRDWTPIGTVDSRAVGDTLLLSAGTIHSGADYGDFVFRFDFRLPTPTAGAALLLRANQEAGKDREYAIGLGGAGEGGRLSAEGMPLHESRFTPPTSALTGWTPCEVRVERAHLTVSIAGTVVAQGSLLDKPAGRIGFRAGRGGIELRGMRVAPIAKAAFHPELPAASDPGLAPPTVKRQAQPDYPDAAQRQRISGTVLLDIVILPDGLIGDIQVAASPHRDLIPPAIACIKKWRFNPATKDGVPVAVTATVELAFTLKR
jgi:TonB family protein